MTNINPEVLDEVGECIKKIKAFLKEHNRRICSSIKPVRNGHDRIDELEQFGAAIPDDFRALYYHYDGTKPAATLSMWEWSVFLEFYWSSVQTLVVSNKVMRLDKQNPLIDRINAFSSPSALSLLLDPNAEKDGKTPLLITLGTLSRNAYIAFDSTLDMLRSVCAAQDAGILSFEEKANPSAGREKNEIYYDVKELWDIIRPFNSRANYWTKAIANAIEWDRINMELPEDGIIRLDPEVKKLIVGETRDYYDKAEDEMRRAGTPEEKNRQKGKVKKED